MKKNLNRKKKNPEEDTSTAEEKLEKIIEERKTEAEAYRKIIKSLKEKRNPKN